MFSLRFEFLSIRYFVRHKMQLCHNKFEKVKHSFVDKPVFFVVTPGVVNSMWPQMFTIVMKKDFRSTFKMKTGKIILLFFIVQACFMFSMLN